MSAEHHRLILSQYAAGSGALFYRSVMGDGSPVIHYGIYENGKSSMRQATEKSTIQLWEIALTKYRRNPPQAILDLGAGPGGSAHWLARRSAAKITCAELCEHHNEENLAIACALGIDHLIETWTGSFEQLPDEWEGRFDWVWSQEALCHARDSDAALQAAYRALRPGGVMVFSDILLAENAPTAAAAVFQQVNAISRWSTVPQYRDALDAVGFVEIDHHDWTPYLHENFLRMRAKIAKEGESLIAAGVPSALLQQFAKSLDQRIEWKPGSVLGWGAFSCIKPDHQLDSR